MEVTLTNALKYGVEYFFKVNNERGGNISLLPDGVVSGSAAVVGKGLKTFGFRNDLKSFITVLKTEGNVDIVSKPHVLVQEGKTSVIKIGREEPIRRGTSVSENGLRSEDILYKDVGVILSVGVEVEENNVVKLHLNQEVSDIIPPTQDPLIDSPSFTTNTIQLDTLLNDGQSIYIGGLMETAEIETVRKVPYLSDIPYLGKIFRSKNFIKTKTELILLLSVEILFDEKDFENQKLKFVRNK
jgi:type II secretory pathway component GspD/PulD (secretin)